MQLSIVNLTGSTKTYLSGAVAVLANSTLVISSNIQKLSLAVDGQLRADIYANLVQISDSVNIFAAGDAIDYLKLIPFFLVAIADSSGNGITSTINSGKQALDVNITNLSVSTELLNGQLFSTSIQAAAATASADNPIMLLRNPIGSGKIIYIKKIICGIEVVNIPVTFKIFGQPVLTNTATTITNITQASLSTTVTVTTSTPNGATVGATTVISGTTNFNGTYTVASVTSSTIYTFTNTAPLLTTTNTSGTSTINSSLGTNLSEFPLKRVAAPTAAVAEATYLPTVSSNGDQLITIANGQNAAAVNIIDSTQISLEPGQNLLVAANPSSNNRSVTVTIIWAEV